MKHVINITLNIVRFIIFLFLFFFLLFIFIPSYRNTCSNVYSMLSSTSSLYHYISDTRSDIPEHDLRPIEKIKEFYKDRNKKRRDAFISSRLKYPNQHFIGSVMKNGESEFLPEDYIWHDGKVMRKEDINS